MKINLSKFKGIAFDLDDTLIDRKKAFDKLCIKLSEDFDCFNHFSKKLCKGLITLQGDG